jgi:hypothetical protein
MRQKGYRIPTRSAAQAATSTHASKPNLCWVDCQHTPSLNTYVYVTFQQKAAERSHINSWHQPNLQNCIKL